MVIIVVSKRNLIVYCLGGTFILALVVLTTSDSRSSFTEIENALQITKAPPDLTYTTTFQPFELFTQSDVVYDKLPQSQIVIPQVTTFEKPVYDSFISYPWKGDPICKHFTVQKAANNSLPKWALTSFPGSGVTWTRQMIEELTGIYTGSVYLSDPLGLPIKDYKNEYTSKADDDPFCGCTIIDKDHEATETVYGLEHYFNLLHVQGYSEIINKTYNYRGVLLLRNPMDVVFTYQHYVQAGKVENAPPEVFHGPEWEKVVDFVAYAWADHAIRWIEQIREGTVIFYENLLGNQAILELERLLVAMNLKPTTIHPDRMRCTLTHQSRQDYKRKNKKWLPLEENHRIKFLKSIHRVQESLRRRNWPQLPVHLYDMHMPLQKIENM